MVDERGQPVAGAVVRAVADDGAADGSKTAADGAFALALGGRHLYIWGVVAETDGGADRPGSVRGRREGSATKDPVKIVLKPSRPVRVRVNDAAGLPVPGAAVEAIDPCFPDPRHDWPRWNRDLTRAGRRQGPVGDRPQGRRRL